MIKERYGEVYFVSFRILVFMSLLTIDSSEGRPKTMIVLKTPYNGGNKVDSIELGKGGKNHIVSPKK